MPFDLQSILAALGMGGGTNPNAMPLGPMQGMGGFMAGNAPAASAGINTGPAQVPTPPPAPGGLAGLFGGGGGQNPLGPMGLLGAGASMLNASGPGNAGIGSILGSGIGGLIQGQQLDRTASLQQQQQAALARIAEQLMKQPSGAQPAAAASTGPGVAAPPPMPAAARPVIPGAAPAPAPASGGMPFGGGGQAANPFIQMMLARRIGRMA